MTNAAIQYNKITHSSYRYENKKTDTRKMRVTIYTCCHKYHI